MIYITGQKGDDQPDGNKMFRIWGQIGKELYNISPSTLLDSASTGGHDEVHTINRLEKIKMNRRDSKQSQNDTYLKQYTNNTTRGDMITTIHQSKMSDIHSLNFQINIGMVTNEEARDKFSALTEHYNAALAQIDIDFPIKIIYDLTEERESPSDASYHTPNETSSSNHSSRKKRKIFDLNKEDAGSSARDFNLNFNGNVEEL